MSKLKSSLYTVGGSIRDLLFQKEPVDFDFLVLNGEIDYLKTKNFIVIRTNEPTKIKAKNKETGEMLDFSFSNLSLEENLATRDFTINSLAIELDPETLSPIDGKIIDYYGGITDAANRLLRTINSAEKTLIDDPKRIFRAIRFVADLELKLADELDRAINNFEYTHLDKCSDTSINLEIKKILSTKNGYFELFKYRKLCEYLFSREFKIKFRKSIKKPKMAV